MSPSLKFASINIEGHKHLDRVIPFLRNFKPDVVCFQELFEQDIEHFERELQMKCVFMPMAREPEKKYSGVALPIMGVGILTSLSCSGVRNDFILELPGGIPSGRSGEPNSRNRVFLSALISKDGFTFRIGNTHFTWSPDGSLNEEQRRDFPVLLSLLGGYKDIFFSGDFNAPRGGEIFTALSSRYKDNIPSHYTTSIDKDLHRAGDLQLMVDGLFSTPDYTVTDVKLSSGVSDHMAVTALISKS